MEDIVTPILVSQVYDPKLRAMENVFNILNCTISGVRISLFSEPNGTIYFYEIGKSPVFLRQVDDKSTVAF